MVQISFAQDIKDLNGKAAIAHNQGEYLKAVNYSEEALEIIGEPSKANKDDYKIALNNLAYAQMSLGDFREASVNFRHILSLYNKKEKRSVDYLEAVSNVAKIYNAVSKFDSVEIYYNIGVKLFDEASQKNNKYYRKNLYSFFGALVELRGIYASLLSNKGYSREAITHLEPLVESIQVTFPDEYKSFYFYATLLNNIGNYYLELGDLPKASFYFQQYSALIDQQSKPADYLQSLTNIGSLYSNRGNADSAIYYYQKAVDWGRSKNLQTLTAYKSVLVNLGSELAYLEKYDSALIYLKRSLEIQNTHTGYDAYLYKNTLFNLASVYNWSGNYDKATEIWRLLLDKLEEEIQYNFTFLTEAEKRKFFQMQQFYFENFANYCLEVSGIIPSIQYSDSLYQGFDLASDLYNNRILTKGLILNSTNKMRQRILNGDDENAKHKFLEWIDKRYRLITLLGQENPDLAEISQLQTEIEQTEIELSRISDPFRKGFVMSEINWKDIQSKLLPGEVAIETIRILNGAGYLALILTSETVDQPHIALVITRKSIFLEKGRMSYYNNAIKFQVKDTLSYKIFWEPIITEVRQKMPEGTKISKVYFSPDGIYHQINLNTLYNKESNQFLVDELDIVMMESTKHLAGAGSDNQDKMQKNAVLVGNPTYTLDEGSATNYFSALPGSAVEVNLIAEQLKDNDWNVQVNVGSEATSASIKNISSPKIVHIATHGFFINLDTANHENSLMALLLNSGLALVGVNQNDSETREAGILRAFEATNLNLDNTELVVLSACQSGVGNYYPGEGVYGLQKAIFAAGAKHLIMSLWKVDDEATQLLMNYFYTNYLESNDLQSAFKMAQIKLREKYPDPKYWGAFVLLKG
jgi:CHAT domain-containing protein